VEITSCKEGQTKTRMNAHRMEKELTVVVSEIKLVSFTIFVRRKTANSWPSLRHTAEKHEREEIVFLPK
jgi:hypothetical protein